MGGLTRAMDGDAPISPQEREELRRELPNLPPEFLREIMKLREKPAVALVLVRAYLSTQAQYQRRFKGVPPEVAEAKARQAWDLEAARKRAAANAKAEERAKREREDERRRPSW